MKRILINATQKEELRVALVDGQRLYDLDIENRTRVQKKANLYKGIVTRVEPSLEAAFINFGADRHGFLPLKEISSQYYAKPANVKGERTNPKELIPEGTELVVQVEKEERGNKGAALTTYISLAGRYLVLMPNNPKAGGISRRIEGDDRTEIREALRGLEIPDDMGLIVRTAGVGKDQQDLQWDLDYLLALWKSIQEASSKQAAPFLIYQESNVIIRTIRDYLRRDIGEVLIDTEDSYNEAITFIRQVMPQYENRIKLYQESLPLFNHYQIESQIESAFEREVKLPSGGSVVIDPTEALISIDINSSRATRGADIEETALNTNLEAADEIARQLRLRDMGGLVVIDFIDMTSNRNQREVENRMRDALEPDRARVQIGRISRFGLLEMSRQRLRPSLGETSAIVCPRCNGQGTIRDVESLSLSILRILQEEANKQKAKELTATVPLIVSSYLLNEKRGVLSDIETQSRTRIVIVPNPDLETPHYEITGLNQKAQSYDVDSVSNADVPVAASKTETPQQPAVQAPTVSGAPVRRSPPKKGLIASLIANLFGGSSEPEKPKPKSGRSQQNRGRGKPQNRQQRGQQANRSKPDSNTKSASSDTSKPQGRRPAQRKQVDAGRGARNEQDKKRQGQRPVKSQTNRPDDKPVGRQVADSSDEGANRKGAGSQRRQGNKRPRNTTPRTRGPRPAKVDSAAEVDGNIAQEVQSPTTVAKEPMEAVVNNEVKFEKPSNQQPKSQLTDSRRDAGKPEDKELSQSTPPPSQTVVSTGSETSGPDKQKTEIIDSAKEAPELPSETLENEAKQTQTIAAAPAVVESVQKTKSDAEASTPAQDSAPVKDQDEQKKSPPVDEPTEVSKPDTAFIATEQEPSAVVSDERFNAAVEEALVSETETKSGPVTESSVPVQPETKEQPEATEQTKVVEKTSAETVKVEEPEPAPAPPPTESGRAINDPREVKRRQMLEQQSQQSD